METGIHFAGTIVKFTTKSYAPQCAPQTTPVFVSAFVLDFELTMHVVYHKNASMHNEDVLLHSNVILILVAA